MTAEDLLDKLPSKTDLEELEELTHRLEPPRNHKGYFWHWPTTRNQSSTGIAKKRNRQISLWGDA